MIGVYLIYAYKERQYKKMKQGIAVDTNEITNIYARFDIVEIFVDAANEDQAITKAKLFIERPYYDVGRIQEKQIPENPKDKSYTIN
jgi:hypothetical protein